MKVTFSQYWHKTKRTGAVLTETMRTLNITEAFKFIINHQATTGEPCGLIWDGNQVALEDVIPLLIAHIADSGEVERDILKSDIAMNRANCDSLRSDCYNLQQGVKDALDKAEDIIKSLGMRVLKLEYALEASKEKEVEVRDTVKRLEAESRSLMSALPIGRKKRTLRKEDDETE